MNAAVGLMDGLSLDGDRCIRVIPRQRQPINRTINIMTSTYQQNDKYHDVNLSTQQT